MGYTPRLTAPSTTDKNYLHTSAGGKNSCILIKGGSVLPNCVGYAWGRFMEILGSTPKLSRGNAENWYGNTGDGYQRGKTPKLGAVICWAKGKAGVSSDGVGHVAVVEQINSDGSIVVSQSGYNSKRFWTSTIPKGYARNGYTFQGFIYNPAVSESAAGYKTGNTYTLQANMNVRITSGTDKPVKKVSQLTADGKKNATSTNENAGAVLKKGTKVTVQEIKKIGNDTWIRIPSGWICAVKGSTVYLA